MRDKPMLLSKIFSQANSFNLNLGTDLDQRCKCSHLVISFGSSTLWIRIVLIKMTVVIVSVVISLEMMDDN